MSISTARFRVWIERRKVKLASFLAIWLGFLFFGDPLGNAFYGGSLGGLFFALAYFSRVILQAVAVIVAVGVVIGFILLILRGLKGRE